MTRRKHEIDPAVAEARARIGGLARQASMSAEERSAHMSRAATKRWADWRAAREAAGIPVKAPETKPRPSARALEYYLGVIDREQPNREWASDEERRTAAVLRARQDAARAALKVAKGDAP